MSIAAANNGRYTFISWCERALLVRGAATRVFIAMHLFGGERREQHFE